MPESEGIIPDGEGENKLSIFSPRAFFRAENFFMEKRIAVLSIIVEENAQTEKINFLLHEYREYIKGRMGIPEVKSGISVICVVLDAPADVINSVTGKLGMLSGVKAKSLIR